LLIVDYFSKISKIVIHQTLFFYF